MCGIVGLISTKIQEPDRTYIKEGLTVDVLRGPDSTGLMVVNSHGKIETFKKAISGPDFVQLQTVTNMLSGFDNRIIIGHNRKATVGGKDIDVAHPHSCNHIHLVHNGTITGWSTIAYNNVADADRSYIRSDSMLLTYLLAHNSPAEVAALFEDIGVIIWYDSNQKTINALRSRSRELSFGITEGTLLLGSEEGMIQWLADRNPGLKLKEINVLTPGVWWSLKVEELTKSRIQKVKFKEVTHRTSVVGMYNSTFTNQELTEKLRHYKIYPDKILEMRVEDFVPYSGVYGNGQIILSPLKTMISKKNIKKLGVGNVVFALHGITQHEYDKLKGYPVLRTKVKYIYKSHATGNCIVEVGKLTEAEQIQPEPIAEDRVVGPDNKLITVQQAEELLKHGCSMCTKDLFIDDLDTVTWTREGSPICEDCEATVLPNNVRYAYIDLC